MTQLRPRFAAVSFLIRFNGWRSVSPNLEKSTFGQGMRFRPPKLPPDAVDALPAPPLIAALTKACTSSWVILPFGPEPLTWWTVTPSSRANLRTEGLAWLAVGSTSTGVLITGGGAGARTIGGSTLGAGAVAGSAFTTTGAGAVCATAGTVSAPLSSSTSTMAPSEIESPTLTLTSFTRPECDEGTSIVALSDSRTTIDCSFSTRSPAFTNTSMTGTSL